MVVGVAEEVKEIRTKKGDLMAFVRIADFTGPLEVVLFPKTYEDVKALVGSDKVLAIEGTMSKRNDAWSLLANKVRAI
jgi:DNA polymerase-3 subunit alpha